MGMPKSVQHVSASTCAECLNYWGWLPREEARALYTKLWDIQNGALSPTPLGGDGSSGTVETPSEQDPGDDTGSHWWSLLTKKEQAALAAAALEEWGE